MSVPLKQNAFQQKIGSEFDEKWVQEKVKVGARESETGGSGECLSRGNLTSLETFPICDFFASESMENFK